MTEWQGRLDLLADELTAAGKLSTPGWQAAFRAVPRHVLVPEFHQQSRAGWTTVRAADDMAAVYSNRALHTAVDQRGHGVSSSSMPGLMTRMLELLDIRPGHRVLEIGTGTGYNAALLSAYLGDECVFSVDIDYVDAARERLASLGYRPTLRRGDGADGMAEHAPFDRIMATAAVRAIPQAWVRQLRDGGRLLADVKLATSAGNLVLLHKDGSGASGRFDTGFAAFMAMRDPRQQPAPSASMADPSAGEHSQTALPARVWEQPVPWFLASFAMPGMTYGLGFDESGRETTCRITGPDGSVAVVDSDPDESGRRSVVQAGPRRVWDAIESGYAQWEDAGRPEWGRFGLSVPPTGPQVVWLDDADSAYRWPLPDQP